MNANGLVVVPLVVFGAWRLSLWFRSLLAADDLRSVERCDEQRAAWGRVHERVLCERWER